MPHTEPSRVEIFRTSRIHFFPDAVPAADFDFVRRLYRIFLNRDPEFTSFVDPLNSVALRVKYLFRLMGSAEAQHIHPSYRNALECFARALGYTAAIKDVTAAIFRSYPSMELLLKDMDDISEIIEENSKNTLGGGASLMTSPSSKEDAANAAGALQSTSAEAASAPMTSLMTPDLVSDAFIILLKRPPTETELGHYAALYRAGRLDLQKLLSMITESEEFGIKALTLDQPSRHVAGTVISTLMQRDPGEGAVGAYSGALQDGYALKSFLNELLDSAEFRARLNLAPVTTSGHNLKDFGRMLDGMLVAKLALSGCAIPPAGGSETAITGERIRSMILTLSTPDAGMPLN